MRELTQDEIGIIQRPAKWLRGEAGGERADFSHSNLSGSDLSGSDLHYSNLSGSNLRYSNLSGSNLSGSNMDFAAWPLWCGSVGVKADERLFAQLLFHLTRLDVSGASGGVREAMEHIRRMASADLFCEFRDDVKRLED